MNYHIVSDTHFNHKKLVEWGRPEDFEKKLLDSLNTIPEEDVLIHLGDVCIGNDELVHTEIANLKCKKILVRGNHDKKSARWYMDHGWDFVVDAFDLDFMGHKIRFTHRPENQHLNQTWTVNIHGHTHGNKHRGDEHDDFWSANYHRDISPELVGFRVLRLDTYIKSWQ